MILLGCSRDLSAITFQFAQRRQLGSAPATRVANAALRCRRQTFSTAGPQINDPVPGGHPSNQRNTLKRPPSSALEQINDATKWTVVTVVTATVGVRHDAVSLWCVIGSVIAAATCKVLMAGSLTTCLPLHVFVQWTARQWLALCTRQSRNLSISDVPHTHGPMILGCPPPTPPA
jgi:hypothetical protein